MSSLHRHRGSFIEASEGIKRRVHLSERRLNRWCLFHKERKSSLRREEIESGWNIRDSPAWLLPRRHWLHLVLSRLPTLNFNESTNRYGLVITRARWLVPARYRLQRRILQPVSIFSLKSLQAQGNDAAEHWRVRQTALSHLWESITYLGELRFLLSLERRADSNGARRNNRLVESE